MIGMIMKTIKYLNKQIKNNNLNIGSKIDFITTLSSILNISKYKVKKDLNILENIGIIEKFGKNYYLLDLDFNTDIKIIQKRLIKKAQIHLNIMQLLNNDYNKFLNTMIYYKHNSKYSYTIIFPINSKIIHVNTDDIQKVLISYSKG